MAKNFSNTAVPTSLSNDITNSATSIPLVSTAGFPSPPFSAAINQGTVDEEILLVNAMDATTFTNVVRGYDGTAPLAASTGDDVRHVVIAEDYRKAALHMESLGSEHLPPGIGPLPYAGAESAVPTGWLLCNGQAVSRTEFANLFAVIGVVYGPGNGSSTFNLPDLRGRMPLGRDNMGGSSANVVTDADADTLGAKDGVEFVTLTVDQIPAHTHTQTAHSHTASPHTHAATASTGSAGDHRHQGPDGVLFTVQVPSGGAANFGLAGGFPITKDVRQFTEFNGAHTHTVTVTNASTTVSLGSTAAVNANTGGDQAHTNMPPFIALNYIIKT